MRKEYKVYLYIEEYKQHDCYEVDADNVDLAIEKAIQRVADEMDCNISYDDIKCVDELVNGSWREIYSRKEK